MSMTQHFLCEAIELAFRNLENGGRPFGAVVVKADAVIATGVNEVLGSNDPTAHAELVAIRAAGRALGTPDLKGCTVFASGHPCPMCLAAMRIAGVSAVTYAYTNEDGAPHGFSTAAAYADLAKPFAEQSMRIRHEPARLKGRPDLYGAWTARQARPAS